MRTILTVLGLFACSTPPSVEVTKTQVNERSVLLSLKTQPNTAVVAMGKTVRADQEGMATLSLSIQQLQHGTNEVEVQTQDGAARATTSFELDLTPTLFALSCPKANRKSVTTAMVTAEALGLEKTVCPVYEDGTMPLIIERGESNKVTLGGVAEQALPSDLPEESKNKEHPERQTFVTPSLLESVMQLKLSEIFAKYGRSNFELPIEVSQAGAETLKGVLEISAGAGLARSRLTQVATGSGLGDPRPPRSAVYVKLIPVHYGADGPLAELDLVVLSEDSAPREIGKCGPYTGSTPFFTRKAVDQTLVAYDRAGKEFARTTLKGGDSSCPFTTGQSFTDYPNQDRIDTWVRGQLTK